MVFRPVTCHARSTTVSTTIAVTGTEQGQFRVVSASLRASRAGTPDARLITTTRPPTMAIVPMGIGPVIVSRDVAPTTRPTVQPRKQLLEIDACSKSTNIDVARNSDDETFGSEPLRVTENIENENSLEDGSLSPVHPWQASMSPLANCASRQVGRPSTPGIALRQSTSPQSSRPVSPADTATSSTSSSSSESAYSPSSSATSNLTLDDDLADVNFEVDESFTLATAAEPRSAKQRHDQMTPAATAAQSPARSATGSNPVSPPAPPRTTSSLSRVCTARRGRPLSLRASRAPTPSPSSTVSESPTSSIGGASSTGSVSNDAATSERPSTSMRDSIHRHQQRQAGPASAAASRVAPGVTMSSRHWTSRRNALPRSKNSNTPFQCNRCKTVCYGRAQLDEHIKTHK